MRHASLLLPALLLSAAAVAADRPDFSSSASATDNTKAALKRIRAANPRVNAVIAIDPTALDQARTLDRLRRARGPLFGMPILIKDNIETLGPLPTTAGSLALANNVTGRDAPLVARLRAAGAVILGKANLSEWANIRSSDSISGWSAVGGQVRNPYALNRNPCGSSSGSAVAVASGMVPAAIGTETDGSIVSPASASTPSSVTTTTRWVSPAGMSSLDSGMPNMRTTYGTTTRTSAPTAIMLSARSALA